MFLQIFLPCFLGQKVRNEYEKLHDRLFSCNWIPRNKKFRKSMNIVMGNMKNTVKVSAFGFWNVDFETFATIVNSAFSLLAALKSF
jgi:odorant receptor